MTLPKLSRGVIICFSAFAVVTLCMMTGLTHGLDIFILQTLGPYRVPIETSVWLAISNLGNWQGEVPLLVIVVALLWVYAGSLPASRYLLAALSSELLWILAKWTFHRPRPTILPHLDVAGWYSYPSGHSMLAPMMWGLGPVLLAQLTTHRVLRHMLWAMAGALPLAIGLSRIYLGVHYPTDVIGGLLAGTGLVLLWWPSLGPAVKAAAARQR